MELHTTRSIRCSHLPTAGQLSALKHSSVSNSALSAFGASMDLGPGVQGGLTGFMILPYKEFSFADGVPASQVSFSPHRCSSQG